MILRNDNDGFGKLVHEHLSQYLDMDVGHYIKGLSVLVFGGAVRDALAGENINDIDIVGTQAGCGEINYKLQMQGYKKNKEFGRAIEPRTDGEKQYVNQYNLFYMVEMIKGEKQVHLMVPKEDFYKQVGLKFPDEQELCALMFASNVDLTNCAVAYNMHNGFISFLDCAVGNCLTKEFFGVKSAKLRHEENIQLRTDKFISRGWTYKGML